MIPKQFVSLAPALVALTLGGCGPSQKEQLAADYCPRPFQVQDARSLTRFRAGTSAHDPRDIVFEAGLIGAAAKCSLGRHQMDVDLVLQIAVSPGPAAKGVTSVPYFVRVLDSSGKVVQGQEFNADFDLTPSGARRGSKEELSLTLPFEKPADVVNYGIAVGLKPTPEELDYNRRNAGR